MDAPIVALSRTAQWHELISRKNEKINPILLKNVPFTLICKIEELVEKHWETIADPAYSLLRQFSTNPFPTVHDWMLCVSGSTSPVKIENILKLFKSSVTRENINKILLDDTSPEKIRELSALERKRHDADKSKEKGMMYNVSVETLCQLSKRLVENENWKLIADGLGFSNEKFSSIKNPFEMLTKWKEQNKNATRARLFFEAEQLGMRSVCNFINAIPVEGTSKVSPVGLRASEILSSRVTRFHIDFIKYKLFESKGVTLSWRDFISLHFPNDPKAKWMEKCQNPSDIIWQMGDVKFETLLKLLKKTPEISKVIDTLLQDIQEGDFALSSSGGVTLEQIYYLSQANFQTRDPFSMLGMMFGSGPKLSNADYKAYSDLNPFSTLAKRLFPEIKVEFWRETVSFEFFLSLYWQFTDSEGLNLHDMGTQLVLFLKMNSGILNDHNFITDLEKRLGDLFPLCEYDPELAAENLKKMQDQKAEKVKKVKDVSQPILEKIEINKTCAFCRERVRKFAIVPCGHYGFCLECITSLNQCAICMSTIKERIEIFDV